MKLRVRVRGYEKAGRLADRFRAAAEGGLRDDLGTELRGEAPAVVEAARARVMRASFPAQVPSTTSRTRSTDLRVRLAAATGTQDLHAPPGVRFTVDGSAVNPADPRGGHALARYTDVTLAPRWRHQTFGRTEPKDWFMQLGDPWFFVSVDEREQTFRDAVERAMNRTARRIEG